MRLWLRPPTPAFTADFTTRPAAFFATTARLWLRPPTPAFRPDFTTRPVFLFFIVCAPFSTPADFTVRVGTARAQVRRMTIVRFVAIDGPATNGFYLAQIAL